MATTCMENINYYYNTIMIRITLGYTIRDNDCVESQVPCTNSTQYSSIQKKKNIYMKQHLFERSPVLERRFG